MISGVHAILYSRDAEADRAFFRDVLGWPFVDAHDGWLIFAQPPAELAVHPTDGPGHQELYLMCTDLESTLDHLRAQGVDVVGGVSGEGFGRLARLRLPGGGQLGIYQPRHPSPLSAGA